MTDNSKLKKIPKKRGRKPKKNKNTTKAPPKKRGRKPKGGKIIKKCDKKKTKLSYVKPNIILHLKCSTEDLKNTFFKQTNYTPKITNPIAYNIQTNTKLADLQYQEINCSDLSKQEKTNNTILFTSKTTILQNNIYNKNNKTETSNSNVKNLWKKLNQLAYKLKNNDISDKRSACFWCTFDFDNPTIFIPKQYCNNCLEVYGCFCSPECALSYLKNEDIDNSTKWERYALLNNVYGKIYNYEKNIKPAPNPFYTLNKYYGNLTISEYRKLLKNDRILMIVNKPMTKILPELYEENNDIPNIYYNMLKLSEKEKSTTAFRLKRSQEKTSKTAALLNSFNL